MGCLFFALNDSVVRFWSLQAVHTGQQRLKQLITPSAPAGAHKAQGVVSAVSLSRDDKLLATLDSTGSLTVWDLSGEIVDSPATPLMFVNGVDADASPGTPTALEFTDDGKSVFFAASAGEVRECDVRNRCGPVAPQRASAPLVGGQWKELSAPAHGKWIAAVSDQQIVSFFRPGDLSIPFFQIPISDKPAPVVSRGYAILSGTPGRPVSVISSSDGSRAAVFERQQYGFNERLRLVHLTDQPTVHDVNLVSGDCDGRFLNVQFDPFASYVVVLSKFGCIAFAKLQDTDTYPIVAEHPLHSHQTGLGIPSLTFTSHYISISDQDRVQLWSRDQQTGMPGRLLLDRPGGTLLLPINETEVIFAETGQANTAEALTGFRLTTDGELGPPVPIGSYSSVKRIAVGGALVAVIGTHQGTSQETAAVWSLADMRIPLMERPADFGGSVPKIVFDSASKQVLVGPSSYSLKADRPDPRIETALLFDLRRIGSRVQLLDIDLGDQKEECESGMNSCYELEYLISPDGAWLGVSRSQSFGLAGPASVWLLGAPRTPRLNFPAGSELDFDRTSNWLMVSTGGEQRLWRLDANSGSCLDQGRISSSGFSWFLQNGRTMLTLTSGEITLQPLDIDDLIIRVPDFVGRNLSPAEWAALFPKREYEEVFPGLPPNAAMVSDLVNRAEILVSAGKRDNASKVYGLAAQFAIKTDSIEINKMVMKSALKAGLGADAGAALEYMTRVLPKDHEVQELLRTSGHFELDQDRVHSR